MNNAPHSALKGKGVLESDTELSMPTPDLSATREYLRTLWPGKLPEGGHITFADKARGFAGTQFNAIDEAATYACGAPDRYLVMSAMRRLSRGRGKAADVIAVPGFWFDADCLIGAHAKTALPNTIEEAIQVIRQEAPLQPSIILGSGGGIYCLWLLDEPWALHTPEEHKRALATSKAVQASVVEIGRGHGWEFDDTSDLPRCLRANGTLNGKYDPPRRVALIHPAGGESLARYTRGEFDAFFPKRKGKLRRSATSSTLKAQPDGGSRSAAALALAVAALGQSEKVLEENGTTTGAVLRTCPCCGGLETNGGVATGTAHVTAVLLQLRCKRASCDAAGDGLDFEQWSARFVNATQRAEIATALSGARSQRDGLYTDVANADRFLHQHGRDVRYCPEAGGLFAFNGLIWEFDSGEGLAMRFAKQTARKIVSDSGEISRAVARVESEGGIHAMVNLAKFDILVPHSAFDADPMLLAVANGTIDLRTGKLLPHRRDDRITKLANVKFDENAHHSLIDGYFEHVSAGSADYGRHIERVLGYLITGSTREGLAFFLLGRSFTGKTTFIEVACSALGDGYTNVIPFAALLRSDRDGESPRPFLYAARGSRIVSASEVNEGSSLDAAVMKSITGGDTLPVRDLHGRPIRMRVTFKLLLAVNHMPRIEPKDDAVRRRVHVLPFDNPIGPGMLDHDFLKRVQASPEARSAWLARAVRGAIEWNAHGLGSCEVAELATKAYWDGVRAATDESQLLADALAATHEQVEGAVETNEQIRAAVASVLGLAEVEIPGSRRLAAALRKFGCEEHRTSSVRGWVNLKRRVTG